MGQDGLAEVGLQPLPRLPLHGEPVVLGRDGDAARAQVLDRMVAAAVAERELERLQPDGLGEDLVAEADAEHGRAPDQLPHRLDQGAMAAGSPGPGTRKMPSASRASTSSAGVVQGSSSSVAPRGVKLRTIERLMPVSSATMRGPEPSPAWTSRLGERDLAGEVAAGHGRLGGDQRPCLGLARRGAGRCRRASRPRRGCGGRARACRRR